MTFTTELSSTHDLGILIKEIWRRKRLFLNSVTLSHCHEDLFTHSAREWQLDHTKEEIYISFRLNKLSTGPEDMYIGEAASKVVMFKNKLFQSNRSKNDQNLRSVNSSKEKPRRRTLPSVYSDCGAIYHQPESPCLFMSNLMQLRVWQKLKPGTRK